MLIDPGSPKMKFLSADFFKTSMQSKVFPIDELSPKTLSLIE